MRMKELTLEFATHDDCLDKMVPSDLRKIISERDTLRERISELEEEKEEAYDNGYRDAINANHLATTQENRE